ncbi:hypothetical protein [Winogradskyella pulchriflava]|uniref:DUF4340 domain-containing protein n=1 Tax=Winogradskyella pulchriflava TaxID=1110688 RepID=A0ABV6QBA0_9FLAO
MKSKVLKYSVLLFLAAISVAGIYYLNLSSRHKAIVKTRINHTLGLVDNTWNIINKDNSIILYTPTLVVDQIYKSMEGPKVMRAFQIESQNDDLLWLTSFETKAISTNEVDVLSNDYVCHTNIDFYDGEHYSRWDLQERIGSDYPRLTSMSNGIEKYKFPEGYGFPVFGNENLFLSTQTLNHNIKSESFSVKHQVSLGYQPHHKNMKPLQSKTVFIMLPYDTKNPFQGPTENNPNMCLPVETGNHSYQNSEGESLSGHWVIFKGKETYRYDITQQLQLKDSTTMHHIATHLHPFAERLSFKDKTLDSIIFTAEAKNYTDKIGLKSVSSFSSQKGVMLYPNHSYELILETNNTSDDNQDMMASMFVFLYDKEMHEKLKAYNASK